MKALPVVVGISGASGAIYGIRLLKALISLEVPVAVILSDGGIEVLAHELAFDPDSSFEQFLSACGVPFTDKCRMDVYYEKQISGAPASGSFMHRGMVVCPCSMKSLAAVSSGLAANLLTRSADVCLKENRPLILVPRETPFNLIHLENMVRARKAGAVILPASPSFYTAPPTIDALVDTVVARILDHLKIAHELTDRWGD